MAWTVALCLAVTVKMLFMPQMLAIIVHNTEPLCLLTNPQCAGTAMVTAHVYTLPCMYMCVHLYSIQFVVQTKNLRCWKK